VGGVAFKRRATPLDGSHAFAFLHALRPSIFRAPGWGAPALLSSCCRWTNATSRKLVPFSHRSASRIFIRQPGCILHQWSPRTVTTSLMVGRSKPGCGLCPALSFEDLHHPCWGGGRGCSCPSSTRAAVVPCAGGCCLWPCGRGELRQRESDRPQAMSAPACLACWLSWLWRCLQRRLLPLGPRGGRRWSTREDLSGDLSVQVGAATIRHGPG
jgi:hypothetical protein